MNQFEELRRLILEVDREENARKTDEIITKLDELEKELNDPDKFANVIQQSKAEVIDVLGPVMGKMIKKFISSEIEKLKEGIERKSKAIFSFEFLKRKIKSKMTGVSEEELLLSDSIGSSLLQVFAIEKDTGILIGTYSPKNILEADLVAGMLSAIKSFVESAFGEEDSELESLSYSNYKILLYNFNRYYFACVLEGIIDAKIKEELQDEFLNLADKELGSLSFKKIDGDIRKKVELALSKAFELKYGANFRADN
ncbi:hypothetical protein [Crocinitomix catalasitica]|uniref:hypothetical protein n=1 Tax=Crocinitomix catalasitica TaxID=184607 RepID=UPI0012F83B50|nr:hypothetical protein [Crocinitomix catalasitica]